MCVGLLCSVIVTQRASDRENDLGVFGKKETAEGKGTRCNENKRTLKIGQAFAENQWISECIVEASLHALIVSYEAFIGHFADHVTHK